MKTKEQAAFEFAEKAKELGNQQAFADVYTRGMSKREYFAITSMQGILTNPNMEYEHVITACNAVKLADALLEELVQTSKNE